MASADSQDTGRVAIVLGALSSASTRRATRSVLIGLPIAVGGFVVIAGLFVLWVAAILSLAMAPTGLPGHIALYAAYAVAMPIPMLWTVRALSAMQRARLREILGVEIPVVRPAKRRPWPIGAWRAPATWRQLGFHLLALLIGGVGGALVVACWTAPVSALAFIISSHPPVVVGLAAVVVATILLLAAPWMAVLVTRMDEASARKLLGPSRSDELTLQVESLARSRADIVAATDAERRRIERDLHDGAQQRLVSLAMNLGSARANLTDISEAARQAIIEAHDEALLALSELREFIRGLHPAVLNDRGLDAALSGIVAHAPLPVRLRVDVPVRCSPSVEAVAYFVVSEALTNVAKYAQATRAGVTVERVGELLRIVVTDDGRGGAQIPPDMRITEGAGTASTSGGTGLLGLAQRAASVDGTLTIDSPPGGPTTITAELPCES